MGEFKKVLSGIKELLKDKLNGDNLELFTAVDKELDRLSTEHEKVEEDLSQTKDKLIEVVKNTSFKDDSIAKDTEGDTDDSPVDIDKALESAIDEVIAKRNK